MSATLVWRQALQVTRPDEKAALLSQVSTPEAVEEALAEVSVRINTAPPEALPYAEIACEMAARVGMPKLLSCAEHMRGRVLRALHRHKEAIEALEAAARYALNAGDEDYALRAQQGIVDSLGWMDRYQEAFELARDLKERFLLRDDRVSAARVLANVGNVHHRRDDYRAALAAFDEALVLLDGKADPNTTARVHVNRANALTHLNRIHEAAQAYEWARQLFVSANDLKSAAVVDLNVGFLKYLAGEYTASIKAFTSARQTFERLASEVEAAKVDLDMGDAYRALNLLDDALECYDRGIAIFRARKLDYELARAQIGRAVVLAAAESFDEAMAALEQAERFFAAQGNRLQLAHVGLIRAHVLRAAGKADRAAKEAAAAARTLAEAGLHGWAAEAAFIKYDVELEQGRNATAGMEEVVQSARAHLRSSLESRAQHALGRYYMRLGDTDKALEHLRASVEALEHARTLVSLEQFNVAFVRDKLTVYEDLVATLLSKGRTPEIAEALEYVERSKSRLLLERVQRAHDEALRAHGDLPPELAQRLADLRAALTQQYHGLSTFDGSEQAHQRFQITIGDLDKVRELEEEYSRALREAELVAPDAAGRARPLGEVPSVPELQAALAPDEALVEYACLHGQVAVFVLTKDDMVARLGIADASEVEKAARKLRFNLQRVEADQGYVERHREALHRSIREALGRLYDLLLRPLESLLKANKLVIVPHSLLHGLPLHAAWSGESYALDRWEIAYSPGAAIWYTSVQRDRARNPEGRSDITQEKALLMAVPTPSIELVRHEVEQLSHIFRNATVLYGADATLAAFREHAPKSRVIHLAAHAEFRADNPLFSGLVFADDRLIAHDLYDEMLDCDLATLSACRTAASLVEPGDELFGLMRGFLAAGARSLAVSLWPAADDATLAVMVRFYKNLAGGMNRAAALRKAQTDARVEFPHPYHWAAFALIGAR